MRGRPNRNEKSRDHESRLGETAGDGGPDEAARYLAVAVADLGLIARRHGLDTLASSSIWRRWRPKISSDSVLGARDAERSN